MTNPTIKALQSDLIEWNAQLEQDGYIHLDEHDDRERIERIRAALRTLIEKHEDAEGDMPREIWANQHLIDGKPYPESNSWNTHNDLGGVKYIRADTIINEITRRLTNEQD